MVYADYYYTYQIGIVFAILVAALLLLAATVAGIYFACVGPMRERSSSASPTMIKRAPPLQSSWTEQPPPPVVVTLPPQTTYTTSTPSPQQPTQAGGSEYMAPIGQRVSPAYSQQIPLVQPIDYLSASGQQQYRVLQPVALQQQQTTVQTPGSIYYDPNQGAWQSVLNAPPRTSYQASAV